MGRPLSLCCSGTPESARDVFKETVGSLTIQPLVRCGAVQGTEVTDVGSDLDIIKILFPDADGNTQPSAVPRDMVLRMVLVDVLRQQLHANRVVVAAHHGDASDIMAIALDEGVDGISIQRQADVLPQIMAVAARTAAGAVGYIDGQRHLVGDLLKNNTGIDVLQHSS